MGFSARVLCDSLSVNESRLITVELTKPRIIHSEMLRHRAFAFNVASSRAIPIEKIRKQVQDDPVIPIHWGAAQSGMQAFDEIPEHLHEQAKEIVLWMRDQAMEGTRRLQELGLAKQVVNRYLEPWMWCTVICTGNDRSWRHFWSLRCDEMAEPHIRRIAEMTREVIEASKPVQLQVGEMHLPLFGFPGDENITDDSEKLRVSSGRCARVSYETHLGIRDVEADLTLSDRLVSGRHWSPTEHQAICSDEPKWELKHRGGNLGPGWIQYRKMFAGEFTE